MIPASGVGDISGHLMPFGAPCHFNILLNFGIPALMIGSMTPPHPPLTAPEPIAPDFVSTGIPTVLMNGIPAITVGMIALHPGGDPTVVATGWPNILIGG